MEDFFAANLNMLAEDTRSSQEFRFYTILISLLLLLTITAIIVGFTVKSIVKPITELTLSMKNLAEGDNNVTIKGTESKNCEIAEMSRAVLVFKENALKNV